MWQLLISSLQSSNWARESWRLHALLLDSVVIYGPNRTATWLLWSAPLFWLTPFETTYFRFARPHLKDLKYWRPNVVAKCGHARRSVLMTGLANPRSCISRAPVLLWVHYQGHRVLTEKTARARGRFFDIRWYTWLLVIGLPYFVLILPSVFLLFRYFTKGYVPLNSAFDAVFSSSVFCVFPYIPRKLGYYYKSSRLNFQ